MSDSEFVSATFRIPKELRASLERLPTLFPGLATVSNAVRHTLEVGLQDEKRLREVQDLDLLQEDASLTIQQLVAKWNQGGGYSRAELAFLAYWARQAYLRTPASNVQKAPLAANLLAFAAIWAIRAEIHGHPDAHIHRDRYYQSNLGSSFEEPIPDKVQRAVESLPAYPYQSQAAIASACLDEALRNEPSMPVERLNDALKPYLTPLMKLAVRGLYLGTGKPVLNEGKPQFVRMHLPASVCNGTVTLIPVTSGASLGVNIAHTSSHVSISVQSFPDLCELLLLVRAVMQGHTVTGGRFQIAPPTPNAPCYILRTDGVQLSLLASDFEDLRTALDSLMKQPSMMHEAVLMAWVYGDI